MYGDKPRGKALGDFQKGGSKSVVPADHYKFRAVDFKVVIGKESQCPYVIVDSLVIGQCPVQGEHAELGFSLSPAAESIAYAWFTAFNIPEDAIIPTEDADELKAFLMTNCKGAIFQCTIDKTKRGGYDQNSVNPPWEVLPDEMIEGDLTHMGAETEEGPNF